MHHGDYVRSFVDLTLIQYVPGAQISARLAPPQFDEHLDGLRCTDHDDGENDDDALADSVRSIYLEA